MTEFLDIPDETACVAAVDESLLASTTSSIVDNGLDTDSVAGLKFAYAFTNGVYDSAEFMTQRQWYTLSCDGVGSGGTEIRSS